MLLGNAKIHIYLEELIKYYNKHFLNLLTLPVWKDNSRFYPSLVPSRLISNHVPAEVEGLDRCIPGEDRI